jgi:outer membrane protein assembly factor BamD
MGSLAAMSRRSGSKLAAVLLFCSVLLVGGCANLDRDETADWTPEEHYAEAKAALKDGLYEQAIKYFEKLESRYPYGLYAQQAQMEMAYAYFKQGEPAQAIATCERFLKAHPNHEHADYMYYLKGLATFNEDLGLVGKISGEGLSDRDPKGMRESFDTFKTLVARFPKSQYAEDSLQRMDYLLNSLAEHELHVARYYFKRGAFLAAANRAQYAIRTYPETSATEEALGMMIKAYDKLGLKALRDDAEKVLRTNFPASSYLPRADALNAQEPANAVAAAAARPPESELLLNP